MSDDRPACYWDDTLECWIIRASAIGGCKFEMAAAGQGFDPLPLPGTLVRAFREGHDREGDALNMLLDEGWTVTDQQREGELIISDRVRIRYHPDGLGVPALPLAPEELHVIEVKWLSDANWRQALRSGVAFVISEYAWQLSVMMHAEDAPGVWVFGNKGFAPDPDTGIKPYCEDQDEIRFEFVPVPPISLTTIREKALEVVGMVQGNDLLSSGLQCDKADSWPCLFRHLLPPSEESVPDRAELVVGDQDQETVERLVREYLYHKGQADESKRASDRARDELVKLAGGLDGEVKRIITNKFTIPVVNGRGNPSYDFTRMPQHLREALEKFKVPGKTYRYIKGIKRND